MDTKLRRIENKLLLYFNIVANGCKDYIDGCEYSPYYCGYSKASDRAVNTYELCLFEIGVIKCPGEIEKHYKDKHHSSTYRAIIRALESLEKKGYIEKENVIRYSGDANSKWYQSYKLKNPSGQKH
jgi:hypothetical protein